VGSLKQQYEVMEARTHYKKPSNVLNHPTTFFNHPSRKYSKNVNLAWKRGNGCAMRKLLSSEGEIFPYRLKMTN
jgi:hypothetical protein